MTERLSELTDIYNWNGSISNSAGSDTSYKAQIIDQFVYDELGRRIATKNGVQRNINGQVVRNLTTTNTLRYDLGGNVIMSTDAGGINTMYAYDALNNKVREREATAQTADQGIKFKTWEYDGFGRVLKHQDIGGNVTTSTYTSAGQLASTSLTALGGRYVNVTYRYDIGTGQLLEAKSIHSIDGEGGKRVVDASNALNQLARYSYDRAGNRITEQTWMLDADEVAVRAVQNQQLTYDERGRLTRIRSFIPNADYDVKYSLDAFGNRLNVNTTYTYSYQTGTGTLNEEKTIDVNYRYDAMNRQTHVSGSVKTLYLNGPRPVYPTLPKGGRYDEALPEYEQSEIPVTWKEFDNVAIAEHNITYDWTGNRTADNVETYAYDTMGRLSTISNPGKDTGYRHYDSAGRVIASKQGDELQLSDYDDSGRLVFQRTLATSNGAQRSLIQYQYDTVGNMDWYKVWGANTSKGQLTDNFYDDNTRLLIKTTVRNDGASEIKTSELKYDANGYLVEVTGDTPKRTMINDMFGRVLIKNQDGVTTKALFANGQMIGDSSGAHETFSSVHDTISSAGGAASGTSVYVVQADGETLTGIAKSLWGDERLWYLIADANGLTASKEALKMGQALIVPAEATTIYNGADTFEPYRAGEVVGSTTPELALPPPEASGKGGCGGIGMIVMIVVAVVVTYITAGAASAAMGSLFAGGGTAVAGSAAAIAGGIAGGAIGAAAGSITSQAVGIAIGAQSKFSWKAVTTAAIGGAVTAGIGSFANSSIAPDILVNQGWQGAAARAALSNVASQGIGIVTGLQKGFSWTNVAASAIGAGIGASTTKYLSGDNPIADLFGGNKLAISTASSFTAGLGTALARGGKIEVVRIATDAFGNALGSSLSANISGTPDLSADKWDQIKQDLQNSARTASLNGLGSPMRPWSGDGEMMQDFDPNERLFKDDYAYDNRSDISFDSTQADANPLEASAPSQPNDNEVLQRVEVVGKRLSPQEQEAWYKYQMRASMPDFGPKALALPDFAPSSQISDERYNAAAKKLDVDVAAIKAIAEVETKGSGFTLDGRPTILFERHRFSALTDHIYDDDHSGISNEVAGGYGMQDAQYMRLDEAYLLNPTAALKSASWGQFQIMGENFKQAGFSTLSSFIAAQQESADRQLDSFVTFVSNDKKLLNSLREQDWQSFAKRYNGQNYEKNQYGTKMKDAYEKYKK